MLKKPTQASVLTMSTVEDFKEEFFALSPDIIGLVSLDGYFSYVSPAVTSVLGYSPEEFMAQPLMSYVHPEDVNLLLDEYHSFIIGKKEFSIANRCKHKDGSYRYLVWKANPNLKNKQICTIGRDITDIVHAEEELKRFFNLTLDFMAISNFDNYFTQVNPAFERELGYTSQELTSVPFTQFIHPDDISATLHEMDKLGKGVMTLHFENRFRHKNGQYRTLSWKAYPSVEKNKVYATARDITELRKARNDLEQKVEESTGELVKSRAFLNSLIENMPNMVFVKEAKELKFIRFNKAGEDLLGFKVEDLYGKNDYDFFPKDQADFFTEKDRKVLSGKSIVDIPEEEIGTKYRGTRILHTKKIPIYDADGKPEYLLGISEDITEIKLAETERIKLMQNQTILEERERISKREAFLAEISEILSSSLNFRETLSKLAKFVIPRLADWGTIIVKTEDGKFERIASVHADEKTNELLQSISEKYPPNLENDTILKTVIGEQKSYFFPVISNEMLKERISDPGIMAAINLLGCYSTIMVPIVSRDNTLGVLTLNSSNASKKFTQEDLEIAEDIGRRAGVAIENALLYAMAKMAIKSRDDFISIASHELKTPITSLKLQVQMTKRAIHLDTGETPSAEKLVKILDGSNLQIDRLSSLVEDLLDVTRIESGKLQYHFEVMDISKLVKEIVDRYGEHLASDGIALTLDLAPPIMILGDRYRLEQVMINLLTNAAKYGEQQPVAVKIQENTDSVSIRVIDRGMGIEAAKLEKIFERFERAVSPQNISGLGLGLYISKEIIHAHEGTITAQSDQKNGTVFTVTLPFARKH